MQPHLDRTFCEWVDEYDVTEERGTWREDPRASEWFHDKDYLFLLQCKASFDSARFVSQFLADKCFDVISSLGISSDLDSIQQWYRK